MAAGFAVGAFIDRGISALGQFAVNAFESAGATADLAAKTGLTTTTIQQMQFVAGQTGTTLDAFTNAAFKLGVNLARGSDSVVGGLEQLGLSLNTIRQMSPDQQFDAITAALGRMEDPQERNRIGMDLFGKTFAEIAPAVAEARKRHPGVDLLGPLPADTLFYRASHGEFDVVPALSAQTGYPILADALSGVRFGAWQAAGGGVLCGYETFLRTNAMLVLEPPMLVIQIGAAPISAALNDYLSSLQGAQRVMIDGNGRWSDEAFADFRHRLKRYTGRSWGVSMEHRLRKLSEYLRGWMGYFGISDYYHTVPELDRWLRRRVRMCYWKQWRYARTKVRHLLALGTSKKQAIFTAISRKSYWHLSKTLATQSGMTNGGAVRVGA